MEIKPNLVALLSNSGQALRYFNSGDNFVWYLASAYENCKYMGNIVEYVGFLGKGQYGEVYSIKMKGINEKEYAVKTKRIYSFLIKNPYDFLKIVSNRKITWGELYFILLKEGFSLYRGIFFSINKKSEFDLLDKNSEILIHGIYGIDCLKLKEIKRNDGMGISKVPGEIWSCYNEQYPEFIIGSICAKFYLENKCINFLNVFGFSSCLGGKISEVRENYYKIEGNQFIFMEKSEGSLSSISKCIAGDFMKDKVDFKEDIQDSIVIQTLFAIAKYQTLGIQHNDLHFGNIFYESINKDTEYEGSKLMEFEHFRYIINETSVYISFCPLIIKVADFGFSVKYSQPMIGYSRSIEGINEPGNEIPNYFTFTYDLVFFISTALIFYGLTNKLLINVVRYIVSLDSKSTDEEVIEEFKKYVDPKTMRPHIKKLNMLRGDLSARSILQNKEIMGKFLEEPENQNSIVLGNITKFEVFVP